MIDIPPRTDYIADGTGRDTYIRRDPTATYGKVVYRPDGRAAASRISAARNERAARFSLPQPAAAHR